MSNKFDPKAILLTKDELSGERYKTVVYGGYGEAVAKEQLRKAAEVLEGWIAESGSSIHSDFDAIKLLREAVSDE